MAKATTQAEPETETVEVQETFTPTELASELGVDPKRVRAYLRANFTRPIEAKNTSWMLSAEVAEAVIEHFTASVTDADDSEADEEELDLDESDES